MTSQSNVVRTATIRGVTAVPVDVEVDVGAGLPSFSIVGLADAAIYEARERVRSAFKACGFELPSARITVNLAPGPLRKHGTSFDLPIALAILIASRQLPAALAHAAVAAGELSLDGRVRAFPGLLSFAVAARDANRALIAPEGLSDTLAPVHGLQYRPVGRLSDFRRGLPPVLNPASRTTARPAHPDFADVVGQPVATRALLISAAGGHSCHLVGPPGAGKTMLARRLPGILPDLTSAELVATALVHSVAGLDSTDVLRGTRPFRAPHHTSTVAGLVGGGSPTRPGEASLAHNGVLFLDEMPEFSPAALQALRQPLEDGFVSLVRADGRVEYPARFALIGAANPCPCGHFTDPHKECVCSPAAVSRYQARIGGPLMDRFDLVVHVARPEPRALLTQAGGTSSSELRAAVGKVREFQARSGRERSADLSGKHLLAACHLDSNTRRVLETAAHLHQLSGRAITRVLRVARTVADIDCRERVAAGDIDEALGYRCPA